MIYGNTPLATALRARGLYSRPGPDAKQGWVLVQKGRDVGQMTASVGWCLVRLLDGACLDDCRRCDVQVARQLLSQLDRPLFG